MSMNDNWYKKSRIEKERLQQEIVQREQKQHEAELSRKNTIKARDAVMNPLLEKIKEKMYQTNRETTFNFGAYSKLGYIIIYLETGSTQYEHSDESYRNPRPAIKISANQDGFFKVLYYQFSDKDKDEKELNRELIDPEKITDLDIHNWLGELVQEQERRKKGWYANLDEDDRKVVLISQSAPFVFSFIGLIYLFSAKANPNVIILLGIVLLGPTIVLMFTLRHFLLPLTYLLFCGIASVIVAGIIGWVLELAIGKSIWIDALSILCFGLIGGLWLAMQLKSLFR